MTDVAGKLIGWRTWEIDLVTARLRAPYYGNAWEPGQNLAQCRTDPWHQPPVADCGCGLYAYHDGAESDTDRTSIAGVVLGWGEVEVYAVGWRAEYAEILCLVCSLDASPLTRVIYEYVADEYGVPVLTEEKAGELAAECGVPVTPEMLPEPEAPREPFYSGGVLTGNIITTTTAGMSIWPPTVRERLRNALAVPWRTVAKGLTPRRLRLDGTTIRHSNINAPGGVYMLKNCMIDSCNIYGEQIRPGKIAYALLSIGIVTGSSATAIGASMIGLL